MNICRGQCAPIEGDFQYSTLSNTVGPKTKAQIIVFSSFSSVGGNKSSQSSFLYQLAFHLNGRCFSPGNRMRIFIDLITNLTYLKHKAFFLYRTNTPPMQALNFQPVAEYIVVYEVEEGITLLLKKNSRDIDV